jgi:UDP-N-acetylglucosamine acyltransferase
MANVHPTAVISSGAHIGNDVEIGPYSVIDDDVIVGDGCQISSSVRLHSGVRLGTEVRIFHGAALGGEPQDLKFGGEKTEVFIGDKTIIREFVTVHRGTLATKRTSVGKQCMLMAYSHVAHDCVIGDNVIMANSVNIGGHVEIDDFAIIGGLVPVHQFVHIGRHCMVGGGVRVPKDVPPYILASGDPAHYLGLNAVGLRRRGFPSEVRATLKKAYRCLFQSELNTAQAVAKIQEEFGGVEEVQHILEFIKRTKRGLLPGTRLGVSEDLD